MKNTKTLNEIEELHLEKLGKVVASEFYLIGKKCPTSLNRNLNNKEKYACRLIAEKIGAISEDEYKRKIKKLFEEEKQNQEIITLYEKMSGETVRPCGIFYCPKIEELDVTDIIAHPAGLISDDTVVIIKPLKTTDYVKYIIMGALPERYDEEIQLTLACTGKRMCTFIGYNKSFKKTVSSIHVAKYRANEHEIYKICKDASLISYQVRRLTKILYQQIQGSENATEN